MAAHVYAPTEEWGLGLNEELNEDLVRLPNTADEEEPETNHSIFSRTSEYLTAGASAVVDDLFGLAGRVQSRFSIAQALSDARDQRELICACQREIGERTHRMSPAQQPKQKKKTRTVS